MITAQIDAEKLDSVYSCKLEPDYQSKFYLKP